MKKRNPKDKIERNLKDLERRISRVYTDNPTLRRIQKELNDYLTVVWNKTKALHDAIVDDETKQAYINAVQDLTLRNKKYKQLIDRFVTVLAEVNEEALQLSNAEMQEMYALGHNEVAGECRKVGIRLG